MKRLLVVLFFFLLAKAYSQELFFSSPPVFQNLPSFETYSILQDRKGFIWITTDAGICRYDGTDLKVFTKKDGLPENVVFKVYQDDKDRIWFSSISGYLFYYENKAFHAIGANPRLKSMCANFPLTSFFVGEKDTVYCGTNLTSGLLKIPPQDNYKRIIIDSTHYKFCTHFFFTNKLHENECVIGSGYPWKKYVTYSVLFNKKEIEVPVRVEDEYAGNNWKCKSDIHGNIYLPVGKQLTIISKEGITKGYYYFPKAVFTSYLDADNDLWIGTLAGGYLYKDADLSKPPVRFLNTLPVSGIMMDREHNIWVATTAKGVFRCMNKYLLLFNEKEDKAVYLQQDSNQLHVSFRSHKIISLHKNDSVSVAETKIKSPRDLVCSYIGDQISYFGLASEFYCWDKKKSPAPIKLNKRSNAMELIKTGKDSMLALTPYFLILFQGTKDENIVTSFPGKFALQLRSKKILISSRNNSGIYELKNKKLINFIPQLSAIRVNCMVEDIYGNLWIATNDEGLYCYDHTKKLRHLTATNNLIGDKINTLTIDEKNNLWMGSYTGLAKLSYTKELKQVKVTNFNKSHGLPDLQIERICSFKGKIACISKDVFFYFENTELKKNDIPPLNYIEFISINDKPYAVKSTPSVSYDKNNFRARSTLITYKNTEQRNFFYKLAGYDQNWHYSTTGDIQYTNLPHGTYTYMVYGLNNDNLKSDSPAIFTFTIEKPFWLTWWFFLIEIVIVLIIIYFSAHYWKTKIEKKEREKAAVSEFKMTALRSQMNPHFIFNAIGSIQHYILKSEIKQSYDYLSKFSILIRNILNNSRQEYIFLEREINTLRLYIELEQIRFTDPFELKIEIDEELDMEMDIPTMLIQPYVENSIWHGLMPKKTGGILELIFKKEGDSMLVIIRDNGVGRQMKDPEKKHVSKGMSITEQRINLLTSTNKKKFITSITDLKDENGNSIGTEVNLRIPFDL